MTYPVYAARALRGRKRRLVALALAGALAVGLAGCATGGRPPAPPGAPPRGAARAGGLAGCATGEADPAAPTGDAVYRIPIVDPGSDIDPLTVANANAMIVAGLASEGLISLDAAGELVPRLATDWQVSDDGLTWTVTLRDGAKFNDGSPVTAADVVSTFETLTAEDSVSPGKSSFSGVLSSVAEGEDGTVVFSLARPFSDFPLLLTGANTSILPAGYTPGEWLDDPIGAGQFILEDYTVGQSATYKKNPDYWNADAIQVDGVELKVYADPQATLLAFQAGEIDRINVTSELLAAVDTADYDTIGSGYSKFDGIFLNTQAAPFDDPAVRQALAWAIDREGIVDAVYDGTAEVANDNTYFPDYAVQPEGLEQRGQNLDEVATLLAGRTVTFDITTDNKLYGEVLQQQLNAVPGFEVGLNVLTGDEYYADGENSPWLTAPLTITNWAKRAPSQYISLIYTTGADWNASRYSNPTLEQTSAEFDATTDDAERQRLVDDIATIEWTDVPVIVPAFTKAQVLQDKRVKGEFPGALDFYTGYSFAGVSLE